MIITIVYQVWGRKIYNKYRIFEWEKGKDEVEEENKRW